MLPLKDRIMLGYFRHSRFISVVLVIALFSCDKNGDDPAGRPSNDTTADDTLRFRYLALGDSYTIGTALPDSSQAYPIQLVDSLNRDPLLDGDPPRIIAFGGWRTDQLMNGIDTANLSPPYDLVSLLVGVNNQFQNLSEQDYAVDFEVLLNEALILVGGDTSKVFVLSIPDYGVTPFGGGDPEISMEIDAFNAINANITHSYGITYFNITEISRLAENDPNLLAPDNLHPSGQMYTLWVEAIFDEVKAKLDE